MAEYIERDCLIEVIKERNRNTCNGKMSCIQMKRMVETIPAADAAPVRHGKWEYEPPTINTYGMLKCSKCGWWTLDPSVCNVYHYCPNCGARMDMEDE